jgi:hypothetical protein
MQTLKPVSTIGPTGNMRHVPSVQAHSFAASHSIFFGGGQQSRKTFCNKVSVVFSTSFRICQTLSPDNCHLTSLCCACPSSAR